MNKIKYIFSILFIAFSVNLFAEQFQIYQVDYTINGITRENNLRNKIKINTNRIFESEEALQNYINSIKQKYTNLRVFDDIEMTYLVSRLDENQPSQVILNIKVVDSKNFVLVPFYKYDSVDGNVIKAKLKDSNFSGTLNELESEIYFGIKSNDDNSLRFKIGAMGSYSLPFFLGPVLASWDNDLDLSYTFGSDIPEWKVDTGFTFILPLDQISFELVLKQKVINDFDNRIYDDQLYLSEYAGFFAPVKLESIENWGDIIYTPGITFVYNWDPTGTINPRNDDLVSPELLFVNKLSTNSVKWIGNFRTGIDASIQQVIGYNFLLNGVVFGVEGEVKTYISSPVIGFNSRLYGFSYMNKHLCFADKIRGVKDDVFYSTSDHSDHYVTSSSTALVLNLDLPIHIITTDFEKWGLKFLRNFNFEFQISPFIDIALSSNRHTGRNFDLRDGFYCAGIEFLVFPVRWKSLQIRASAGLDIGKLLLKNVIDTSWRDNSSPYEISFGLGLNY